MSPPQRRPDHTNPDLNPCIKESQLSMKCLEKNNYNYESCQNYFDNYNMCKKFWGSVSSSRKRAGIKPYMPKQDERKYILEEKDKGNRVISFAKKD